MKQLLITLVVKLRLLALWRYLHRKDITVIMLHGVAGQNTGTAWRPLWERPAVEHVGRTIRQLCDYYTPISMSRAVRILDGVEAPVKHGLVVTFDDGYRNNFDQALPMLAEMGVPATFFVATGFVETGLAYWVDRLDYALQHAPDESRVLKTGHLEFDLRGLDREALARGYRNLRVTLKNELGSDAEMLEVVNTFAESLEAASGRSIQDVIDSDPFASVATWDEQRKADQQWATLGSHSIDHFRLTAIAREDVDRQLVCAKELIENQLERECEFFCYPNGSINSFVRDRTANAGYRAAVTTEHGLNRVGDDLFTLKRYPMPQTLDAQKDLLLLSGILETPIAKAVLGKD